jgi:hypothetical protein
MLGPAQVPVITVDRLSASILLSVDTAREEFEKERGEGAGELARLFAVYKVENGTRFLLGGLAERRKYRRKESNHRGLVEMAKRKYAESPAEELRVVLEEE